MNINELDPDTINKLGLTEELKQVNRKPRTQKFTKEQVRQNAIKVLAVISNLTQAERARVLEHASKLNEV